MSTSMLYHAFGVSGVKYLSTDYSASQVSFTAEMTTQSLQCPKCSDIHFKFRGKRTRRFHMIPIGKKPCFLNLILHRVECKGCGYLYWPVLPFMPGSKRMTRSFIRMAGDLLTFGTIKDVATFLGVGWDTIKRIHKNYLKNKYRKISLKEIEYVSIDEFSIKKGHNYMTVVTDIQSGAIIYAVEGRKKEDVRSFFEELKKKALHLKAICMDMSSSYIPAAKEYLPGVDIVFDRFHVTAIMNRALDEVRRAQCRKLEEEKKQVLKGTRFLLLRNYASLSADQVAQVNALFMVNIPLFQAHALKEQLRLFWDMQNASKAAQFLLNWIDGVRCTGLKPLIKVANTLENYFPELLNYYKHNKISNGPAEGNNNKIKTLKRQSYGFRDMEYFKLRLYHLHAQKYALCG